MEHLNTYADRETVPPEMRESVVPGLSVRGFPPTVKGILSDAVNGAHSVYRM